jgi:O-methyltransferase
MLKKIFVFLIKKIFSLLGYKILVSKKINQQLVLLDKFEWEPFFKQNDRIKLYYKGLQQSKGEKSDNFPKQCRFYSLQQIVEFVLKQDLTGDFVECGCWKGHSSYIISTILLKNNFVNKFHIFDSFEGGLSNSTIEDKNIRVKLNQKKIKKVSKAFSSTEEEVKTCLSNFPFIKIYNGWIPELFNKIKNKQFAFIHIDVDLYQPTLDSLTFFYPKLLKNGCIVIDDYGSCQFPGAKKAVDQFLKKNNYYMFYEIPMGGCFIIK